MDITDTFRLKQYLYSRSTEIVLNFLDQAFESNKRKGLGKKGECTGLQSFITRILSTVTAHNNDRQTQPLLPGPL